MTSRRCRPASSRVELERGAKVVVFHYCISLLVITLRRSSRVFLLRPGEGTFVRALPYNLITLWLGWWGIPWGPIYTITSLANNFGGGKDITGDVRVRLGGRVGSDVPPLPGHVGGQLPVSMAGPAPIASGAPSHFAPQPYYGPPIGGRVFVHVADGNRYLGTVVQAAPDRCLVAFQDGHHEWVMLMHLSPAP